VRLPKLQNNLMQPKAIGSGAPSQLTTLSHSGNSSSLQICAVCSKKHYSNHPHMIQKVIPSRGQFNIVQQRRAPLFLNKSFTKGINASQNSQRSISVGKGRPNQRSNSASRSSTHSLASAAKNQRVGAQDYYANVDRLRSVNKLVNLDSKNNFRSNYNGTSDSARARAAGNFKSLSPKVGMPGPTIATTRGQ
jgi:hypothetical protein